jgi:hypothetical protein
MVVKGPECKQFKLLINNTRIKHFMIQIAKNLKKYIKSIDFKQYTTTQFLSTARKLTNLYSQIPLRIDFTEEFNFPLVMIKTKIR